MHVINNFHKLEGFVKYDVLLREGDFLFGQIIKRRKDNPEIGRDNIVIKSYMLKSIDDISTFEHEIKSICDATNSRFYVNLNKRNIEAVAKTCLLDIATAFSNNNFNALKSLYDSACGKTNSEKYKKWIVDIDKEHLSELDRLINIINNEVEPYETNKFVCRFPTVNGFHLICRPFNLKKFNEIIHPLVIDIHKDNPTLIYYKG